VTDSSPEALASIIARFAPTDGEHATPLSELAVYRFTEPTPPVALIYVPSFCVIAQGRKAVVLADETYHYDPIDYMLVSAHVPMTGQVVSASRKSPYLALRITLDTTLVSEIAAEVDAHDAAPLRAVAVSRLDPSLSSALVRYVSLLDNTPDRRVLAPLVLREIIYRLLVGPQGGRLRQMCAGDGHARRIARALGWLREHFAEHVTIESLARRVRMSPSALHHHFKSVTAMSPLQYQKRLRLHEARRLMIADGLDAAQASYRVGYESPSQFSREYRRVFGAPPRQSVIGPARRGDQVQMAMVRTPTRLPSGDRPTMRIDTPTPSTRPAAPSLPK
jgi:AraC-like DNA-binding protein